MNRKDFTNLVLDYGFHKGNIERYSYLIYFLETYKRDKAKEYKNSYVLSFYFKHSGVFDGVMAENIHNTFSKFIVSDDYKYAISGTKSEMQRKIKEFIEDGHTLYENVEAKPIKFSKMLSEIKKFYLSEMKRNKKEFLRLKRIFKDIGIENKTILKLYDIFNTI